MDLFAQRAGKSGNIRVRCLLFYKCVIKVYLFTHMQTSSPSTLLWLHAKYCDDSRLLEPSCRKHKGDYDKEGNKHFGAHEEEGDCVDDDIYSQHVCLQ